MIDLEKAYNRSFFGRRYKFNWRAPIVCGAIRDVLSPSSVIDVGCATGDLVAEFIAMGLDAYGMEGSKACLPFLECNAGRIFFMDLRQPISLTGRYNLAICLEVAEHIELEFAHQFVQNLVQLSDEVLMSAAPPGQGGHHHVNCQPPAYWQSKFMIHSYRRMVRVEEQIKELLAPWQKKPGIKAYYQNLLYFERRRKH